MQQERRSEENEISPASDADDYPEELYLEFDASHDPEAIWEWNGEAWIAIDV